MTTDVQITNTREIQQELEQARNLQSEAAIISGSISGLGVEMLRNLSQRTTRPALQKALSAYLEAAENLAKEGVNHWRTAYTAAQENALAFLSEHTGQKLPGMLTLSVAGRGKESLYVEGVDFLHSRGDGYWSACLRVQPSPNCHSTRSVYVSRDTGNVVWEPDDL